MKTSIKQALLPIVMLVIVLADFQAWGWFLVSAAKNTQEVYFLEFQPQSDNICRIMNPWLGRQDTVHQTGKKKPEPVQVDNSNGECLMFSATAGKKYSIEAYDAKPEIESGNSDKVECLTKTKVSCI